MPNSFFSRSALSGPTPFRYSIGLSNMEGDAVIACVSAKIKVNEPVNEKFMVRAVVFYRSIVVSLTCTDRSNSCSPSKF